MRIRSIRQLRCCRILDKFKKMRSCSFIFLVFFTAFSFNLAYAQLPSATPSTEKELGNLLNLIYQNHRFSFFCQQRFDKLGQLIKSTPSLSPKENKIVWSFVVSKKQMAQSRPCYSSKICLNNKGQRFKGLLCCKQTDTLYKIMLHDMHNRLPMSHAVAQVVNQYHFDSINDVLVPGALIPNCALTVYPKDKIVVPEDSLKGEIARILLYMYETYKIAIPASQIALYQKWHESFPPSKWEKQKNKMIYKVQGNLNHFIG